MKGKGKTIISNSNNFLNRKRIKPKIMKFRNSKSKNKNIKRNNKKQASNIKNKIIFIIKKIDNENEINLLKKKIQHFFHLNWENEILYKEITKIGETINETIYWLIINNIYFIEENIREYLTILYKNYLENKLKCDYFEEIPKKIINSNNPNDCDEIKNYYKKILNITSYDIYETQNESDNISNGSNVSDKKKENNFRNRIETIGAKNIICYLNYDKKKKYFENFFGYNLKESDLSLLKNKIKDFINVFNQINKNKIKKLKKRTKIIEEKYKINNSYSIDNKNFIKCIKENPLFIKNDLSYLIRNKFINYFYNYQKNYLINRDNKENIKNQQNEDINLKCYVCNNGDLDQYQYYYECETCGIIVHPFCYGLKLKESNKKWKCQKCREKAYFESINLECILCPVRGGALKRTTILKNSLFYQNLMKFRGRKIELHKTNNIEKHLVDNNNFQKAVDFFDSAWVHLSCAIWNKDIKFGNFELKTNINMNEQNIYAKYNSLCKICGKDNMGPTIKCKIENCVFQCHPECGRINNNYLEVDIQNKQTNKKINYYIYCHNHEPDRISKIINNNINNNIEDTHIFNNSLNNLYKSYKNYYKKDFDSTQKGEINESNDKEVKGNNISPLFKCKKYLKNNNDKKINNLQLITTNINASNYLIKNNIYKNVDIINLLTSTNTTNNETNEFSDNKNIITSNIYASNEVQNVFSLPNEKINKKVFLFDIPESPNKKDNNILFKTTNINKDKNIQSNLRLIEEINKNKDSFIAYLIGFLNDYLKNNRLIIKKGDGIHHIYSNMNNNLLYELNYDDLFTGQLPLYKMQYKDLTINLIKKYLKIIFPDENSFNRLFKDQIDIVLNKLKNNEKYKNREIICRNFYNCIGSHDGKYKLLSIEQFKYQILTDINIPELFICNACLNNKPNIQPDIILK